MTYIKEDENTIKGEDGRLWTVESVTNCIIQVEADIKEATQRVAYLNGLHSEYKDILENAAVLLKKEEVAVE